MSHTRAVFLASVGMVSALILFGDAPKYVAHERVEIQSAREEDGVHELKVQLSNRQFHTFVADAYPNTPLVNNRICVEVLRGPITGRLKLKLADMKDCPFPTATTPRIRKTTVSQSSADREERVIKSRLPTVEHGLRISR